MGVDIEVIPRMSPRQRGRNSGRPGFESKIGVFEISCVLVWNISKCWLECTYFLSVIFDADIPRFVYFLVVGSLAVWTRSSLMPPSPASH
jgi:hypothetical protein